MTTVLQVARATNQKVQYRYEVSADLTWKQVLIDKVKNARDYGFVSAFCEGYSLATLIGMPMILLGGSIGAMVIGEKRYSIDPSKASVIGGFEIGMLAAASLVGVVLRRIFDTGSTSQSSAPDSITFWCGASSGKEETSDEGIDADKVQRILSEAFQKFVDTRKKLLSMGPCTEDQVRRLRAWQMGITFGPAVTVAIAILLKKLGSLSAMKSA